MFGIFSKKDSVKSDKKNSGAWGDGQAVLSAIDDGVLAIDPNGNIRIMNPAAEQIIGWSNGDATNLSFESVFQLVDKDGKMFERESNPVRRALLSFESFNSRELFIRTASGKTVPIFLRINAIDNQNSGLVVVFRNITKEIQESREQNEFISTASHEMRTPVASIEGYLGLALNPATATIDDRAKSFLEKAHENVKHLGQLFQDLLDITKSEDGRLKNEPVVLDAVEFSRQIWDGLKMKANDKGLEYIFELDDQKSGEKVLTPVYFIHADRDHLREVLDNLFENAIKYTPNGKVSVSVTGDNEHVQISVKDSGIGIPAEDIPHLFQKFYRVDNSATREIGGTGLGLYLSRRLTESIGGTLELESEFQKGSTFIVKLPRLTREQAEKLKAEEKDLHKEEERKDEIFESTKDIFENHSEETVIQQPQNQVQSIPEVKTNNQSSYYEQSQAIRNYQIQQYYARQKAASDARARAEQVRVAQSINKAYQSNSSAQNQSNSQNPYFPQNQQIANGAVSNYSPPRVSPNSFQAQSSKTSPTLAEIEKAREEYLRKMMAERNGLR